jgi:general secretion pathway protein B
MSYILDALRKSDQQRQHAKAPTLLTAQSTLEVPHQRTYAFNAWLAAAMICAGILIGWLRPWQSESPLVSDHPVVVRLPVSTPDPTVAVPERSGAVGIRKSREQATVSLPPPFSATATQSVIAPASTLNSTAISQPASNAKPIETSDIGRNPVPDNREKAVLTLGELPAAIRQEMPAILIAFHQYSNIPADRRVMINNTVLRQNEYIAPGLRLEQITPDGVVISYQGYRFMRGVR